MNDLRNGLIYFAILTCLSMLAHGAHAKGRKSARPHISHGKISVPHVRVRR